MKRKTELGNPYSKKSSYPVPPSVLLDLIVYEYGNKAFIRHLSNWLKDNYEDGITEVTKELNK